MESVVTFLQDVVPQVGSHVFILLAIITLLSVALLEWINYIRDLNCHVQLRNQIKTEC